MKAGSALPLPSFRSLLPIMELESPHSHCDSLHPSRTRESQYWCSLYVCSQVTLVILTSKVDSVNEIAKSWVTLFIKFSETLYTPASLL